MSAMAMSAISTEATGRGSLGQNLLQAFTSWALFGSVSYAVSTAIAISQADAAEQQGGESSYLKGNVSPEARARALMFHEHPFLLGVGDEDFRVNPYWTEKMAPYYWNRAIDLDSLTVGFEDLGDIRNLGVTNNLTGRITLGDLGGLYSVNAQGNVEGGWGMVTAFLHETMHVESILLRGTIASMILAVPENLVSEQVRYDTSSLQGVAYDKINMMSPYYYQDQLAQRFAEDVSQRMGAPR
jgi:hypothetical protein